MEPEPTEPPPRILICFLFRSGSSGSDPDPKGWIRIRYLNAGGAGTLRTRVGTAGTSRQSSTTF